MSEQGDAGHIQADSAVNTLAIVQRSLERLSPETLEQAVDVILSAQSVYVTAVRASYAMAYYPHYSGRMIVNSFQLIPRHVSSTLDDLNEANSEDVMIAITTSPYSQETVEACRFAQEKGVRIILITDSDIVAPDLKPEFTFIASAISTHHFACYSGVTAIIEAMLSVMMRRAGQAGQDRIKDFEDLRDVHDKMWARKKH